MVNHNSKLPTTCVKRDGATVPFDGDKIVRAIRRCFDKVWADERTLVDKSVDDVVGGIYNRVLNVISAQKADQVSVEDVQRFVLHVLWSDKLYAAAEHYQNYREDRRKARFNTAVTPDRLETVKADQQHFPTDLQYYQFIGKFSRWRDADRRRETWKETVTERVMPWFKGLPGAQLEDAEWSMLQDSMYNLESSPAMRVVQMAGPALQREPLGCYNCLGVETAFITRNGVKTFRDFKDGDTTVVLTHTGSWKNAVVRNYGVQKLYTHHINRSRTKVTVRATANHRWVLSDGSVQTGLKAGDKLHLPPCPSINWNYDAAEPLEKLYWAYGYVYGDGTRVKKDGEYTYSMVRLCKNDRGYLERFEELGFGSSNPLSCKGDPIVYTGSYLKTLPELTDDLGVIRAFVRGYLDADGGSGHPQSPNDFSCIQVTGEQSIEFVRRVFPVAGYYITREEVVDKDTNFGPRSALTIRFGLTNNFGVATNRFYGLTSNVEDDGSPPEEVWCLEVEDDHSFVLPSGVVTGNCAYAPIVDRTSFSELLYVLMQGTGMGFSVENDYIDELPRIKKQRNTPRERIVVPDSTEGWCKSYDRYLELLWDGREADIDVSFVRKAGSRLKTKGGRACLTGDTVVYKDRKKTTGENTLTIAELYEKRIKTPRRLKHIRLRCLDEATGTFQRNRVLDVIDNGVADVFEVVTEHGYRIRATSNHRFMTGQRVYQRLSGFAVDDLIAVNGAEIKSKNCVDCHTPISRKATRCVDCYNRFQTKPNALENTARARKECRIANVGVCAICARTDLKTQVHHKDRNPLNNASENLLCLCEPCHRVLHATEDTFGNPYSHRYLSFDRIVSISPAGRERVFDICMQAPNHNFVANGFVSHNSGPGPFLELCSFASNLVKSRQGKYLTDLDCHDLACMTGRIVQVGGVRRAAEISLSDLNSRTMRDAKSGAWWTNNPQRSMANNSAVYEEKPDSTTFMEEWLSLAKSRSGERGIFNRQAAQLQRPKRRKNARFGVNPCAEIVLRPFGLCNLSMCIARPDDTIESLRRKVRSATYFGKLQSLCTNFNYVRPEWKQNAEEERLLGVDITGQADCPLLRFNTPNDRAALLRLLQSDVHSVDQMLSERWGVNVSAADTTVKPGGDSSVFFDCSSGVSPRFSRHQIRWVRESKDSPVARFLIDSGVPYAPAPEAPDRLLVFGFPKSAPTGCTLRDDMTVIDQLENWLTWKENWAEHSVSATIYVGDDEWLTAGNWVYNHFDQITGLSFLPRDNGTYTYAPNEEIDEAKYGEMMNSFPDLNWAKLSAYEEEDMTEAAITFACVGGGCDS